MELSKMVKDIRVNWAIGDAKRNEGLTTPEDIKRFDNISYGPYGTENLLDIYVQKTVTELQPVIVNIHGGGWVYGSKEIYQFYCMSLAQRGFTVVNINYRLAPETRFPGAVEDINAVLTFIEKEGASYFIDKEKVFMVGDSAGGQLVSHYATIFTNPDFAKFFSFKLPKIKLLGVGLNCGAYDGRVMAENGDDAVFMEYIDSVGKVPPEELINLVDAKAYMTSDFPPAHITSAENDFLKPGWEKMTKHLQERGVKVGGKIYGTPDRKDIAHVFHVNVKLPEAKKCNDDQCEFFRSILCG